MSRSPTESSFLKDVEHHHMTVVRDDAEHRHIRFQKPGTYCMHFDLITWPGYLCYTGDMGTYVFRRLRDMFEFFRSKPERCKGLHINESYWAEKLEATDKPDGHLRYSPESFRRYVIDNCKELRREMTRAEFRDFRQAIEDDLLPYGDDGEIAAHQALESFEHSGRHWFRDSWEVDFKEYTFRFLWCCYALSWGIQHYDRAKAAAAGAAA